MREMIRCFIVADIKNRYTLIWDWGLFLLTPLLICLTSQKYWPILISLILLQSAIFSIPYRFVQYKNHAIYAFMKQQDTLYYFMIAYIMSRIIIMITMLSIFFICLLCMGIAISFINMMIMSYLTIVTCLVLAGLLGLLFENEKTCKRNIGIIYTILFLVSGIIFPKSQLFINVFSKISPLPYLFDTWGYILHVHTYMSMLSLLMLVFYVLVMTSGICLILYVRQKQRTIWKIFVDFFYFPENNSEK